MKIGEPSDDKAYSDETGGAPEDMDTAKIANENGITKRRDIVTLEGSGERYEMTEADYEEQMAEFEFEEVVPKIYTHQMLCLSCDAVITKVFLRPKFQSSVEPVNRVDEDGYEETGGSSVEPENRNDEDGYEETEGSSEEETEEEEVYVPEFEKMVPKLQTHTIHCRYCHDHITKVRIVRIRTDPKRPGTEVEQVDPTDSPGHEETGGRSDQTEDQTEEEEEMAGSPVQVKPGCLSCFGLFTSTGNCFSINGVFRKEPNVPIVKDPATGYIPPTSPLPTLDDDDGESICPTGEENSRPKDSPATCIVLPRSGGSPQNGITIDIPPVPTQGPSGQESTSMEILKSIVYGGLMEVIASLSVVASAAATDATTLTIVTLALANLVGGVLVISHNLWDLRDDCYKFSTQQTNEESHNKYKELLGQVKHFPLHLFFAILSFIVFGLIPPVVYGFSFHQTNDKDFTIVVVAAASFVCVCLLAIFKANIDRCSGFLGYMKTVTYYLTTAVSVSGVSYAAGNLVTRLVEELGWFETTKNPSLAYY